jgi:hypothetical protein
MKRVLLAVAVMGAVLGVGAGAVDAAQPKSPGCTAWNTTTPDLGNYFAFFPFTAGEVLHFSMGGTILDDAPTEIRIVGSGGVVLASAPWTEGSTSSVSYTIPSTGVIPIIGAEALGGLATPYVLSCTAAPDPGADGDGDGVLDADDLCPDTVLPDAPTVGLKGARFAAQADGTFDSGIDRFDGLYTLADTAGCSATQIIALQDLSSGHTKHGISKSALEEFIAIL